VLTILADPAKKDRSRQKGKRGEKGGKGGKKGKEKRRSGGSAYQVDSRPQVPKSGLKGGKGEEKGREENSPHSPHPILKKGVRWEKEVINFSLLAECEGEGKKKRLTLAAPFLSS